MSSHTQSIVDEMFEEAHARRQASNCGEGISRRTVEDVKFMCRAVGSTTYFSRDGKKISRKKAEAQISELLQS